MEAGEASYTEISEMFAKRITHQFIRAEIARSMADNAPTEDLRNRHLDRADIFYDTIWTAVVGSIVAKLGTDLSKTHQRLAAVEKALQDLSAAVKR